MASCVDVLRLGTDSEEVGVRCWCLGWGTMFFLGVAVFSLWMCAHPLFCFGVWGLSGVSYAVCGAQVWDAHGVVQAAGGHLDFDSLRLWRA